MFLRESGQPQNCSMYYVASPDWCWLCLCLPQLSRHSTASLLDFTFTYLSIRRVPSKRIAVCSASSSLTNTNMMLMLVVIVVMVMMVMMLMILLMVVMVILIMTTTWYLGVVSSRCWRAHRWGFEAVAPRKDCRRWSGWTPAQVSIKSWWRW